MKMIRLKNGAEEPEPVVVTAMMSLKALDPVAFYELVMLAHNRDHKLYRDTEDRLRALALVPLHGSVRNIILSAVEGDGFDMTLGSPVAEAPAS